MKKYKNKKLFKILIPFSLLIIFTFISANSYVSSVTNNISNSVFRLHVIANSDSKEDQELKYMVRDNLINYMNSLTENISSKEQAIEIAKENEQEFYKIAKNTIKEKGYNYDVKINIDNFYFPTKYYGDISLPAGNYDALKVEIGQASGQNWWCVMFPPLCFVDMTSGIVPDNSKKIMRENLPEEEFALISDNSNSQLNFKFKIVEFFNRK